MPREISYTNKSGGVYKKTIPRRCMCVSRYCAWWTHHSINRGSNRITIYNKDANIWEWERVILTELIYNYGKPQNRGNYSGRSVWVWKKDGAYIPSHNSYMISALLIISHFILCSKHVKKRKILHISCEGFLVGILSNIHNSCSVTTLFPIFYL